MESSDFSVTGRGAVKIMGGTRLPVCTFNQRRVLQGEKYTMHYQTLSLKLTIDSSFTINGNFYRNLEFDWLLSGATMVITIDGRVTINGKFYVTGPSTPQKTNLVECLTPFSISSFEDSPPPEL